MAASRTLLEFPDPILMTKCLAVLGGISVDRLALAIGISSEILSCYLYKPEVAEDEPSEPSKRCKNAYYRIVKWWNDTLSWQQRHSVLEYNRGGYIVVRKYDEGETELAKFLRFEDVQQYFASTLAKESWSGPGVPTYPPSLVIQCDFANNVFLDLIKYQNLNDLLANDGAGDPYEGVHLRGEAVVILRKRDAYNTAISVTKAVWLIHGVGP